MYYQVRGDVVLTFLAPALLIVSVNVPEGKIAEIFSDFQVKLHFLDFSGEEGSRKLLLKKLGKFFA